VIKHDLLEGSIPRHMFRLALPNVGGMLAIILFNITDTFFVSRLGDDALAAMGFTFPVVMLIGAISTGISTGAGSLLARAMGSGDRRAMRRIASDGILLSVAVVAVISAIGLASMRPLFSALGADGEVLPLVTSYMGIWYAGVIFNILPPVSDGAMRAMGEMRRPLYVMLTVALMNFILDPILIFGWFGFPAMGIAGAAVATLISRAAGAAVSLGFVHFKYRLLDYRYSSASELFKSWRSILYIGVPGAMIRLLPQLIRTLLTRLAAGTGGTAAVAALAAGSRIESFAMIVSMAVGVSLVPVMGQNWGAGRRDRVQETRRLVIRLAVFFGATLTLAAAVAARPLGRIFTDSPEVLRFVSRYLVIIMAGSAGLNMYNWISEGLNAVGQPRAALRINIFGTLGILVPFILLGARLGDFTGMVAGLAAGQLLVGFGAVRLTRSRFS
jgi:putative MATE family efflux protein